jgi:ABC-type branched-subunit amino acid transport system substrate-binding protein
VQRVKSVIRPVTKVLAVAASASIVAACGSSSSGTHSSPPSTGGGSRAAGSGGGVPSGLTKASGSVRGFDGATVKVAGFGLKAQLGGAEWGAKARIERFNSSNEIPGLKLDFTEFADDGDDPANSLSIARRLVTSDQVFGIVGDVSATNPAPYLTQQQVPYLGAGLDSTYCSPSPSTALWGFSVLGCQVPQNPSHVSDNARLVYQYASKKLGHSNLSMTVFSNDTDSGKLAAKFAVPSLKGAGFNVVSSNILLAPDPISDYTPYVQQLLKSDSGKAPDVIQCLLTTDCIPIWTQLKADGYKGVFEHFLYSDLIAKPMQGTVVQTQTVPYTDDTPALNELRTDLKAVNPKQAVEAGSTVGYMSTDMFIQALKKLNGYGKDYVTPSNLQKVLATMTWSMPGLGGPVTYPASTVTTTPVCNALLDDTDGVAWKTALPFSCSSKTFPVS